MRWYKNSPGLLAVVQAVKRFPAVAHLGNGWELGANADLP